MQPAPEYEPVNKEDCVEWEGARTTAGYGERKRADGTWGYAHRIAWEENNGHIPLHMCIIHKCDNPPCVNIEHLMLGTLGDNSRDAYRKGRLPVPVNPKGEFCKKGLHRMEGHNLKLNWDSRRGRFNGVCRACWNARRVELRKLRRGR